MSTVELPSKRMSELIPTLLEQTRASAIRWMQTDLPGSFVHASRSGSVAVQGPVAGDPERFPRTYSIRVRDSRGDTVELFSMQVFSDTPEGCFYAPLVELVDEVVLRTWEGNPLIDKLRQEIASARPAEPVSP